MYAVNISGVEIGRESDLEQGLRGVGNGIDLRLFLCAFRGDRGILGGKVGGIYYLVIVL